MATQSPFQLFESFLQKLPLPKVQPPAWAVDEVRRRMVSLLNHILLQEPEAQARLFRQKGRVVHVQWRFLAISLIATPPLALAQQLLSGDKPAVRVEGDVQLAAEVNWLADHVGWELEEDLARLIGDVPAHALADGARQLRLALRQFLVPKAPSRTHQAPT
jgi:ubiquinone biosynthesis protein UbiJ